MRIEILMHDVRQIEPSIQFGLTNRIALINGIFAPDRVPLFKFDTEETVDQAAMVQVLKDAVSIGMQIPIDFAHRALQIPKALENEPVLKMPHAYGLESEPLRLRRADLSNRHSLKNLTESLSDKAVPYEEAMLNEIYALLQDAGSFEEAMDLLTEIRFDTDAYADLVGSGMMAADLAGRVTIKDKQ